MQTPEDFSKERLIKDLARLQQRITELEKIEEEKKEYEAELAQTKAMFEGLFEFAPDAILIVNKQGHIIQVNKQAESLFGYTREELLNANHDILVPERFIKKHRAKQKAYMSDPYIRHMGTGLELYGRKKDGSEFPVDIALGPMQMNDEIVFLSVVRDFTESKRAAEALMENEARYRALVAASSQVLYIMSPDWSEMRQLKGGNFLADMEKPNRKWLKEYIHPDDQKHVLEVIGEAVRTGSVFELEHRVRLIDGTLGWTLSRAVPVRNAAGEIVEWFGAASDITSRKHSEEGLLESQAYAQEQSGELKAVIDALPAGVLIAHDPQCSQITCNPTWLEIIGLTEEQNPFKDASCERPQVEIRRDGLPISIEQLPIKVACVTGQPVVGDKLEIVRADRLTRYFYGNAVPLFDGHNAVRGAVSVLLDITDLREAHDKIAGLAAIVESSSDAIVGKTLEGIIVSWNCGAEELYGYTDKEAIGQHITLLAPPDQPDEIAAMLEKVGRGETIAAHDTTRMRKDGSRVEVSLTVSPVKDSTGKIIGASTIAHDISDRKKLEERVTQYSKELERSNSELDKFASIIAHDLRSPLRTVAGFAGLLEKKYKKKLDAEAERFISLIVEGTDRMHHLINDLLQYARAGSRDKPLVPVNVNTIVEKTLANLTFEIQESTAAITVDPLPTVMADDVQLIQLFQNLVGNAIKYRGNTPHINISAKRKDKEWVFQVSDNGIGIDPGQYERIFEIFQRLHTRDEYSGTGIGLAICKKIVESFGGRIWVTSKPGEGSTFFFTLPAKAASLQTEINK
ncbi:MAG: PAS domain S-box protein [Dissulfurispiraceae bacterium]